MTNQTTRRCHWVAQAYLRSFAAEAARSRIWRFGKSSGKPELKRIDKIAVKNHLYAPKGLDGRRDDFLERKLSGIEQWFGHPIWRALCSTEVDLTSEPLRRMLALIVATTYVRTPLQLDQWARAHAAFLESLSQFDSTPSHIEIGGIRHEIDTSSWPTFRDAGEEEIKAAWNQYVSTAGDIAPRLLDMRMAILVAERPLFVTSDNPVMMIHPSLEFRGINDPETTISLPISPTRVLMLDNRHSEPDGAYYSLAQNNPAPTNLLVWRNSIEYMFSPRHPDHVIAELLEDYDRSVIPVELTR